MKYAPVLVAIIASSSSLFQFLPLNLCQLSFDLQNGIFISRIYPGGSQKRIGVKYFLGKEMSHFLKLLYHLYSLKNIIWISPML